MTTPKSININIVITDEKAVIPKFLLGIAIDGKCINDERTERTYTSPSDAITSARHLVKHVVGY